MVTGNNTGIIKLVENAIYGSETNLFTLVDQSFVQIFRTGVLAVRLLQDFQDFDTGQGDLEPGLFNAWLLSAIFYLFAFSKVWLF